MCMALGLSLLMNTCLLQREPGLSNVLLKFIKGLSDWEQCFYLTTDCGRSVVHSRRERKREHVQPSLNYRERTNHVSAQSQSPECIAASSIPVSPDTALSSLLSLSHTSHWSLAFSQSLISSSLSHILSLSLPLSLLSPLSKELLLKLTDCFLSILISSLFLSVGVLAGYLSP